MRYWTAPGFTVNDVPIIYLLRSRSLREQPANWSNGAVVASKLVVLVVEDEPLVRMIARDVVEAAGFEAVEAANADHAIRILESREDIRIVFTDIDMPGSMDGVKLAAAIRTRWPPIEIILTSGYRDVRDVELPARGVFFRKPYNERELVTTLHRMAA